jgi:molecular chaperone GrpE
MPKRIKRAKKKESIHELNQKVKELEGNWKRALADYQNLEKRIETQQKTFVRLANASLIDKLLGVFDDLQRATEHINDHGLKLVLNQLKSVLGTEGVEEIETDGKEFNPETMDCTEMVPGPENKVVKTLIKGYTLNNHVIRPAKVQVGKGK